MKKIKKIITQAARDLALINDHRRATGHRPFLTLNRTQRRRELARIEKYASMGNDPWGQQ